MKRFLLHVTLFILPVIGIISFMFFSASIVNKNTLSSYQLEPTINKLAVGDSHIEMAIDDKVLQNTLNIGHMSESLVYSYNKIKLLTTNNSHVDTIYLGVSYHSFSDFYDRYTVIGFMLKKFLFILPFNTQIELLGKIEKPLHVLVNYTLEELQVLFKGSRNAVYWLGRFNNYYNNVSIDSKAVNRRVHLHYYLGQHLRGISTYNILYYNKIVNYCREENICLIILNTPLHNQYKSQVPDKFKEQYYSLIKNSEAKLIEFNALTLGDDDFLPDGDHVSKNGATKTSEYLNEYAN